MVLGTIPVVESLTETFCFRCFMQSCVAKKQDVQRMYVCMRCSEEKNPREIITHHYAETHCMALSVTTEGRCNSVTFFPQWPIQYHAYEGKGNHRVVQRELLL